MAERPKKSAPTDESAGIQYVGIAGSSKDCQDAVVRFLQYGDQVLVARILTCGNFHGLLLTIGVGDVVAVKSGFASGYGGEGPHRFSYVLQLLEAHGVQIDEYEVTEGVIDRLDGSALSASDLNKIDGANPIRPTRWHDYIHEAHWEQSRSGTLWDEFPPVVPFAVIDPRLIDLAISFWEGPDDRLLTAYRRLEDIVRKRSCIDEHGAKLFSQAFMGSTPKLHWPDKDAGEQVGRGQLFIGAFSAFRNPRAHRELKDNTEDQLAEFLVVNQLFRLEREAIATVTDPP